MRKLLFAVAILAATPASAHDWFKSKFDVVEGKCCGGDDCADIPMELFNSGAIREFNEGYVVNLTLEQARTFNRHTSIPIKGIIVRRRVQPSETGGYAMCIFLNEIKCFFAPNNS